MELNKVYCGDCQDILKTLPENSVDSICCDPPYELGFMGKSWDNTGIANNKEMWAECLRVLKPGGYLLSFGGTRTYHRMAVAIEDAGFEVRDMIEWVYGSGFPKSHNIGKNIEKIKVGGIKNLKQIGTKKGIKVETGTQGFSYSKEYVAGKSMGGKQISGDIPVYEINNEWEGWGTALKPAHEPICMARKPLAEKTVAENVLKYRTGGINIDESRVETSENITIHKGNKFGGIAGTTPETFKTDGQSLGRFPANLLHDNSEEVRECFPETKNGGQNKTSKRETWLRQDTEPTKYSGDSGNASRFFKSIMTDKLCTLCCLPFDIKHDTMSICKNTNVNSAEKNLKTTQATTEVIAPQSATTPDNKKFVQSVKSVGNLCDLCGTYIAHALVGEKLVHQEESALGQVFITEQKKQILDNALASFVELRGKKDTIPTINNLNLLFGFVFSAIENSTIYSEQEKEVEKNHEKKSLIYQAKASKSERNRGLDDFPDQLTDDGRQKSIDNAFQRGETPRKNNHPTVKPIALMEYLIKMVTPKGGIVLDPFSGSGSTLVAAKQNGYQYIGIEMTEEYIPIIEARLKALKKDNTLF